MKKYVSLILLLVLALIGYISYKLAYEKGPKESVTAYIEAVRNGNFDTIYSLNQRTQKQVNLIFRGREENKEELLKGLYEGHKRNFESLQPTDNLTLLWSETFFFIPEMEYKILKIEKRKEKDTLSPSYRTLERVAIITVEIEYKNPLTSPIYNGKKIKEGRFKIRAILSSDVVRGLKTQPFKKGWLFQWLVVEDGSITYWES